MKRYGQPGALGFHGDSELSTGLVDLAVNVRSAPMPDWLATPIAASLTELARYPDQRPAVEAIAARHSRTAEEVLLVAGAAQAFTLIAHGISARLPLVVHPQFTEPEAALRAVGRPVVRHVLTAADEFRLDPFAVTGGADLVIVGNPTNPTSVLHPATDVLALAGAGRILVVDEAFADTVPGEPESVAGRRGMPGLIVIRSLTKTWGLAGLRIGYVLAEPDLIELLRRHQPLWPVSAPALAAAIACASPAAVDAEAEIASRLAVHRSHLIEGLSRLPGVRVAGVPASSFVLIRTDRGEAVRTRLRAAGYAVRRGDTFPGLGPDWLRIAVREPAVLDPFLEALAAAVD
ncbi:MAG TPA: Rv2231c family pyridoxal phosphate-dependent protein CobC [Micromonosporaceae bacterium]